MTSTQYILLVALFLGFGLLEYILGRAQKFNANAGDNAQDMIGFVLLAAITQPLIFKVVALLGDKFVPQYKGMFADMPWSSAMPGSNAVRMANILSKAR